MGIVTVIDTLTFTKNSLINAYIIYIYIYILYFIIASVWKDLNIISSVKHLRFSSRTQEQKAKFGSKHFRVLSESWFESLLSELAWNTVIIMFEMTPEMRM